MYYVYILTNKNHTVLYTGVTGNIEKRVYEHKNKLLDGFTKRYNADKLVYLEGFNNVNDAIQAEKTIKGWKRDKKIQLIENVNPTWKNIGDEQN
ncbi:MAG: GIY-YIG nuclease family protein [Oscillospiraceae bacterium]|nr:GIY-YIG nuclease family protein [Oscillospiraceae bacterium]